MYHSFDASFGNIDETLTIDQSGSLIVNGTTTMNNLVNINSNIGINTTLPKCSLDISANDAILVPIGNDSERPLTGVNGMLRYNNENESFEGYTDNNWVSFNQLETDDDGNVVVTKITNVYANVSVTGNSKIYSVPNRQYRYR